MQTYLNLAIGARRRLANLKANAVKHTERNAKFSNGKVLDWRDVRFANLKEARDMSAGFNHENGERVPVWTTFADSLPTGRRDTFADEVEGVRINHTGWYTDADGSRGTARGIVVSLPHGRFMAGYYWKENGERVLFGDIYADKYDAAHSADGHAETFAEREREYSERWQQASDIRDEIDQLKIRLRELIVMRHSKVLDHVRPELAETISSIREKRETLETDFKDVE